ncbi:MAG: DUF302 domain-containing protein [Ignavibacteriales bacterium]|nr:DUF302 domain-containing protein [Ignavibacteriales bacterium]
MKCGFSKITNYNFELAVEKVTEELKREGFGVLTSIDVKETLKKKINVDFKNYTILGACNPSLAHKALQVEEELGLLLPCNVIIYEKDGNSIVSIFNPMVMAQTIENPGMQSVAEQVKEKLLRVLELI